MAKIHSDKYGLWLKFDGGLFRPHPAFYTQDDPRAADGSSFQAGAAVKVRALDGALVSVTDGQTTENWTKHFNDLREVVAPTLQNSADFWAPTPTPTKEWRAGWLYPLRVEAVANDAAFRDSLRNRPVVVLPNE